MLSGDYNFIYGVKAPFVTTAKISTAGYKWRSIDNADNNMYEILSGYDDGTFQKKLWRFDESTINTCITYGTKTNIELGKDYIVSSQIQYVKYGQASPRTFNPQLNTYKIEIKCPE